MALNVEPRLQRRLAAGITTLLPAYFALVMATGIIAIATRLLGIPVLDWFLLLVAGVAYVILWGLTLLRLLCYFPNVLADLKSHARGPGFFTLVAGTCVLGSALLVIVGASTAARILWFVGLVLWVVVMYAFFTAVVIREEKPALEIGINGAWLIATVATQSLAVLGTLLAPHFDQPRVLVLFVALCMHLLGCMLYLSIITLIFYRFTFVRLTTAELTPPYWINMGAVAITTLAGSTLILSAGQWPLLYDLLPFLKGFTLFFWSFGSWWIPLLLILGIWRHLVKRFPLASDPQYWGMVFPLGMYTVCTIWLSQALELPFLLTLARGFIAIALAAWLTAFIGLLRTLMQNTRLSASADACE
jgi:tellurite resistance protein TehA-like permease